MVKDWQFILFYGVIILPLWRWFSIWDYKRILRRRETKFLKIVKVQFPDASVVTFTSIDTSDKKALEELARKLGGYEAERAKLEEGWEWPKLEK